MKSHCLEVRGISGLRQFEIQDGDIFRRDTRVHIQQPHKTLQQQTRAHQQHESDSEFACDQCATQALRSGAAGIGGSGSLQGEDGYRLLSCAMLAPAQREFQ